MGICSGVAGRMIEGDVMLLAIWNGRTGKVISESVGRVFVEFEGTQKQWLIKGIPGLELIEHTGRGRPAKYQSQADKQRAYRERKAGKALRKYSREK
jgi:hypothetical protein